MRTLSRDEAAARMNQLGAAGEPFVFVVDYEGGRSHVEKPADIDPAEWLYDLRGFTNQRLQEPSGGQPSQGSQARGMAGKPEGLPEAARSPELEASPALQVSPAPQASPARPAQPPSPDSSPFAWEAFPEPPAAYAAAFRPVKAALLSGNSYLLNLTRRTPVRTDLSPQALYHRAKAPYKCWIKDRFVCFSPECFVRITPGGRISAYPMKGTLDARLPDARRRLLADAKEQAEHATIVDLLRNDLSRVAAGVSVTRYRYLEEIRTTQGSLLQTSSEICGQLPPGWEGRLGEILFRLLPAGSVTGAPKKKTCEIIAAAEQIGRGYYTGVTGYFDGRRLDSAVLIRFIEQAGETLFFRSGGGITSRSEPENEYREMIQKIYVPV